MNNETYLNGAQKEKIFHQALEQILAGENAVTILTKFSQHQAWLEPLIHEALDIREIPAPVPFTEEDSKHSFLNAAKSLHNDSRLSRSLNTPISRTPAARWIIRAAPVFLILLGFVLGSSIYFGFNTGELAQSVLPNHPLYFVKLWGESLLLTMPQTEETRTAKQNAFNQRRIDEVTELVSTHKEAKVIFEGSVEGLSDHEIIIAGIQCYLYCDAPLDELGSCPQVEGDLRTGVNVVVSAQISEDGMVIIDHVTVASP